MDESTEIGALRRTAIRRAFLRAGGFLAVATLGTGLLAACGPAPPPRAPAPQTQAQTAPAKTESVSMRLGWLANAQYAGDFAALDKGFYKERGIDLTIEPGGPNI